MNSSTHSWDDVPERILVLKIWHPDKKMQLWGLSHYGHPQTLKEGADVSDEEFYKALSAANKTVVRPSDRKTITSD